MGNIFLKNCLIVSFVFAASFAYAAAANSSGSTTAQRVQALAESQTVPGDAAQTKAQQYYRYGEKLFNAGDYNNSLKYFYAVLKLDNKNVKAWKKTAFCHYKLKKHNNAYSAFKMVLKYDASDSDAKEFMDYYKTLIEKNTKSKEVRQPVDSIWRAAVFPGFGQFYNGQAGKGILIGSAFIVSAGLIFYNVTDEKTKYEKYKKANENQDIAFKQAQESWTSALIWGVIAGAVYAGGIVDAGLNYNCDEAQTAGLQIKDNAVYLAAGYRW